HHLQQQQQQESRPAGRPVISAIPSSVTAKHQLASLEEAFRKSNKPTRSEKKALSERLGIPYKNIQLWFQNRRAAIRREDRQQQDTVLAKKDAFSASHHVAVTLPLPSAALQADIAPQSADPDIQQQQTTPLASSLETISMKSEGDSGDSAQSPPGFYPTDTPSPSGPAAWSGNDQSKTVRPRIKPRKDQTDYLLACFAQNGRPDKEEKGEIATKLGLPLNFVTLWSEASVSETDATISQSEQTDAPEILEAASLLLSVFGNNGTSTEQ
ncbi:hypothetical protein BDR26DRAFT_850711, partial [Obelidium mucronatum]